MARDEKHFPRGVGPSFDPLEVAGRGECRVEHSYSIFRLQHHDDKTGSFSARVSIVPWSWPLSGKMVLFNAKALFVPEWSRAPILGGCPANFDSIERYQHKRIIFSRRRM